jgi:hypothetical protein
MKTSHLSGIKDRAIGKRGKEDDREREGKKGIEDEKKLRKEKEREDKEKKLIEREKRKKTCCSYKIRDSGLLLMGFFYRWNCRLTIKYLLVFRVYLGCSYESVFHVEMYQNDIFFIF